MADRARNALRISPDLVFGYNDSEGVKYALKTLLEIFSVEAERGHGKEIELTLSEDSSLLLNHPSDRGLSLGEAGENDDEWKARLFEFLPVSGDYNEFLFGGAGVKNEAKTERFYDMPEVFPFLSCNQLVTEFMTVTTGNEGDEKGKTISFKEGKQATALSQSDEKICGTRLHFKYDESVFGKYTLDREMLSDMLRGFAVANTGVKYVLKCQTGEESFSEDVFLCKSSSDYINETLGEAIILPALEIEGEERGNDGSLGGKEYTAKVSIALAMAKKTTGINCFYNGRRLDGGGDFLDSFLVCLIKKLCVVAEKSESYPSVDSSILEKHFPVNIVIKTVGCSPFWGDMARTSLDNGMIKKLVERVGGELIDKVFADESKWGEITDFLEAQPQGDILLDLDKLPRYPLPVQLLKHQLRIVPRKPAGGKGEVGGSDGKA